MESYINVDRSKYLYMEVKDWSVLIDCENLDYAGRKLYIANMGKDENSCQKQQRLQRFRRFRNQRIAESTNANYIDHLHEVHVLLISDYEDQFAKDRSLRIVSVEGIYEEVLYQIPNVHLIFKC